MTTLQLYHLAEDHSIPVLHLTLPENHSLCLQDEQGNCYIGLDEALPSGADETVRFAHELGHCLTGSFYNRHAARELRQKLENHADKWAIEELIPPSDYAIAVADGCTEYWQLAERFGVTESFARKAVCWYQNGNLAVDVYTPQPD